MFSFGPAVTIDVHEMIDQIKIYGLTERHCRLINMHAAVNKTVETKTVKALRMFCNFYSTVVYLRKTQNICKNILIC